MSYQEGLQIGTSLMNMGFKFGNAMEQSRLQSDNKEEEKLMYGFYDNLQNDEAFKPTPEQLEGVNGRSAWYNAQLLLTNKKTADFKMSAAGQSKEREAAALQRDKGKGAYDAFRAEPNIDKKMQKGINWYNENIVTGNTIETKSEITYPKDEPNPYLAAKKAKITRSEVTKKKQGGFNVMGDSSRRGGYELRNWNGDTKELKDLTVERLEGMMNSYYANDSAVLANQYLGKQQINNHNLERMASREVYLDKNDEEVHFHSGLIDPYGKRMPDFFTYNTVNPNANPNEWNPISPDEMDTSKLTRQDTGTYKLTKGQQLEKEKKADAEALKVRKDTAETEIKEKELEALKSGKKKKTTAQQKYDDELDAQRIMGDAQAAGLPITYNEIDKTYTGDLTPDQLTKLKTIATGRNMKVYASGGQIKVIRNEDVEGAGGGMDEAARLRALGLGLEGDTPSSDEAEPTSSEEPAIHPVERPTERPVREPVNFSPDTMPESALHKTPLTEWVKKQGALSPEQKAEIRRRKLKRDRSLTRMPPRRN